MLAWGVVDFEQGYVEAGLLPRGLELLKAFCDYFLKCWRDSPDGVFYGALKNKMGGREGGGKEKKRKLCC